MAWECREANLEGFIMKLRLILREAGSELVIRHLTTCPTWYIVLGSHPGSNPSSDLIQNEEQSINDNNTKRDEIF